MEDPVGASVGPVAETGDGDRRGTFDASAAGPLTSGTVVTGRRPRPRHGGVDLGSPQNT